MQWPRLYRYGSKVVVMVVVVVVVVVKDDAHIHRLAGRHKDRYCHTQSDETFYNSSDV
jgi:hypothetical protein